MPTLREFLDAWAAERLGIKPGEVTIALLMKLPRPRDLKRAEVKPHLRHLSDAELEELVRKGERFLRETQFFIRPKRGKWRDVAGGWKDLPGKALDAIAKKKRS